MNSTWIDYKGKKILYTVYSKQSSAQMIESLKEQVEIVKQQNGKVLILDDFRDSFASQEFYDLAKDLGKNILAQKTRKNAILGVEGVKKLLLQGYNLFAGQKIEPFDTKEQALDYLAKD